MTVIGRTSRTMGRGMGTIARGLGRGAARSRSALLMGLRVQVLVVLGLTVALMGAGTAMLYYQVQYAEAAETARAEASAVAQQRAEAILSYSYQTLREDLARAQASATGRLQRRYAQIAAGTLAPRAKQQQAVTDSTAVSSAVVTAEPEQVRMLLFVNQVVRSKQTKAPQVLNTEVRMTMQKVDGKWLVSGLQPLTSSSRRTG